MSEKRGPLTYDELLAFWKTVVPSEYWRPLVEGTDTGLELWGQLFQQLAAVSSSFNRMFQASFILDSSGQTDEPASGGQAATVTLTITRDWRLHETFCLPFGFEVSEVQRDYTPEGGEDFESGRKFFLSERCTFAPGEATRTVTAFAESVGYGYNHPRPGSLSSWKQVTTSGTNATVVLESEQLYLRPESAAEVPSELVGQWVLIGSTPAFVSIYAEGPALILDEPFVFQGASVTGTFVDGEAVSQGVNLGTLWRANAGTLVIVPFTRTHVFSSGGGDITGATSGAIAVVSGAGLVQQPVLADTSGVSWSTLDYETLGLTVTNVSAPSGGTADLLDAIGRERGVSRGLRGSESDDNYRKRIHSIPDTVSPNALRRLIQHFLTPLQLSGDLLEPPGTPALPGFYADVDAADYSTTSVLESAAGREGPVRLRFALSTIASRAYFLVRTPPMHDGFAGFVFDMDYWDGGGFFDGDYFASNQTRRNLWSALYGARAGGVGFNFVED